MKARPTIDVSELPSFAFGPRDPLWWGVVGLIAIEGSMFLMLIATYLYLRMNEAHWPPVGAGIPAVVLECIGTASLLASVIPTYFQNRAARRGDLRGMRRNMLIATALGIAALVFRCVSIDRLAFRWDSNAYGSIFWTIVVLHLFHLIGGIIENATMATLLFTGPVEKKRLVDVEVGGIYWYYTVAEWIPAFVVMYLEAMLFPK